MHVTAIILAAGKGVRFKSAVPKPLVDLCGIPLILHALEAFNGHPAVRDIIVAVNEETIAPIRTLIARHKLTKVSGVIHGGVRRQDSVCKGLAALNPKADIVVIHDAARPVIAGQVISRVIAAAKKHGAAIAAVPVKATVKRLKAQGSRLKGDCRGMVEETLERNRLWEAQTPQGFRRDVILEAYARFGAGDATDDASLVERTGVTVAVVEGAYDNIKVTTPEDIVIAEALLRRGRRRI